jgi:hypothetical protein
VAEGIAKRAERFGALAVEWSVAIRDPLSHRADRLDEDDTVRNKLQSMSVDDLDPAWTNLLRLAMDRHSLHEHALQQFVSLNTAKGALDMVFD